MKKTSSSKSLMTSGFRKSSSHARANRERNLFFSFDHSAHHVEDLRERDADVDDHGGLGVDDGAHLPVVVPHQVLEQFGLHLHHGRRQRRRRRRGGGRRLRRI